MADKYDQYTKDELLRLLRERDRRPRFGLVWERDLIDHDRSVNGDFVALDLVPELSQGTPPFGNLIIEGDNFDALRTLRMSHAGRVKCIYIDPPYNTGNRDFIYNDRFIDREDSYRHSKWLEFMYRRLELARELLAEDGSIWVSIDDNEVFHLGMLMDQVFGEKNRIAICIWQKRYSRESTSAIGDVHEYIFVYAANPESFKKARNRLGLDEKSKSPYKNPNNDEKGPWQSISFTGAGYRPNQMYAITGPDGQIHRPPEGRHWAMLESEYLKLRIQGRIWFGKNGQGVPRVIRYLSEMNGLVPWTWWPHEEVGHTDKARKEVQSMFGTQTAFDTPKPVRLIERILHIATQPDDLVLDFFAGSGTTAQALLNLNAQDGGQRRFILVSNTEATADEPDKNLCRTVCAERVRRVMSGYENRKGEQVPGLGGGFAYLRTRRIPAETLFRTVQHAQVWTALQLIHGDLLIPFDAAVEVQVLGTDQAKVIYLPKISETAVTAVQDQLTGAAQVVVYSWQAPLLAQRIADARVSFEPIPEALVSRFGAGAGR